MLLRRDMLVVALALGVAMVLYIVSFRDLLAGRPYDCQGGVMSATCRP